MLVTVTNVTVAQAPKGYKVAVVSYLKDGAPEQRKLMGFAKESQEAFKKLVEAKEFPFDANIVMAKNEKTKYWDWVDVEVKQQGASVNGNQAASSVVKPGRVLGSNYETSEERARRQVYIIRQSSISSAVEYLKAKSPKGVEANVSEVLEVAKEFEDFVMDVELTEDTVL